MLKIVVGSAGLLVFLMVIVATILVRDFRRLLSILLVLLAALWLSACATTPKGEATFACAPKGYETLDPGFEVVEKTEGVATNTEDGTPQRVTMVGMKKGNRGLGLTFVGGALAIVDPNPDDRNVPLLLNTRYFTEEGKLRGQPVEGPCEWAEYIDGERT